MKSFYIREGEKFNTEAGVKLDNIMIKILKANKGEGDPPQKKHQHIPREKLHEIQEVLYSFRI